MANNKLEQKIIKLKVMLIFDEYCKQNTKTFTSKGMKVSQVNVEAFLNGENEGKKIMATKQVGE